MTLELVEKPKLLSKREIELEKAKYVQSLRDDIEKLQGENNELRNEIARLSQQTQVDYKLAYEESQEQLNTAKKALTESEKMYQKQMDRFLNSETNESARSHCESQLKLLFPAHKAYDALAAIGGDDEQSN